MTRLATSLTFRTRASSSTDFLRPTSSGMIAPGNRTELRNGRIEMTSGTSTGPSGTGFLDAMHRSYTRPGASASREVVGHSSSGSVTHQPTQLLIATGYVMLGHLSCQLRDLLLEELGIDSTTKLAEHGGGILEISFSSGEDLEDDKVLGRDQPHRQVRIFRFAGRAISGQHQATVCRDPYAGSLECLSGREQNGGRVG